MIALPQFDPQTGIDERFDYFTIGTKAFIDGFGGSIKCTVIKINHNGANGVRIGPRDEITVRIDETKGGYTKGEILPTTAAYCPPRAKRFTPRGSYSYRIATNYIYSN